MSKQTDYSRVVSRPLSLLIRDPRGWTNGAVLTTLGIVAVYTQGGDPYTTMDFVWENRIHTRTFYGKTYTERGLVTIANRFAKEIVHGY